MIKVKNLKKYFPIKGGFFNAKNGDVKAVESVNFEIPEGEILGLVGESGSGKTTLVNLLSKLNNLNNKRIELAKYLSEELNKIDGGGIIQFNKSN